MGSIVDGLEETIPPVEDDQTFHGVRLHVVVRRPPAYVTVLSLAADGGTRRRSEAGNMMCRFQRCLDAR